MNVYTAQSDFIAHCCEIEGCMSTVSQCTMKSMAVLSYDSKGE